MTIRRLNTSQEQREKIRQLNEMIMELKGLIEQAKFNKNELDNLYAQLAVSGYSLDRKFLRNVSLGHTAGTYTNWSHLKAETGYSIWKFTPTHYAYNALNQLYLDNILLRNLGEATSESATTFDKVFFYNGSTYTDDTTEAGTETGTEFGLMEDTSDYLYVGHSTTYGGIKFEFQTRGSGYGLTLEYWNGSSWSELTSSGSSLDDNTSDFESDGLIEFDIPGNWATTTVNSVASKYWIRISTTATPITVAQAYYVVPANSVIGLLALSSDEIINGDWAWCSYNGSIYVTLRNAGSSAYEGNYYITSSSSSINLQNFFIYNHEISLDHEDSTYSGV